MKKEESFMWLIISAVSIIALIAGVVYLTASIAKFGAVKALAGDSKGLKYFISFSVIAVVFVILAYLMSPVNAIVIFLNEILFFLILGAVMRIITRFSGKEFSINWQGWLSIGLSVIYLVIGYFLANRVWQTDYKLKTDKNIELRIALFADSHIGATFDGDGFAEHLKTIEAQRPDIVLIAGDFVDDWSKKTDMLRACQALGEMDVKYGVWYSYGNHDEGFFAKRDFTATELESALTDNGIHILADEYELVDDKFYVVGRKDSMVSERKTMDELLSGIDDSKYIIVIDHEPNDYANEAASVADLVVSGHTHGGQMLPINRIGEWLNINDRTYGYERRNGTDFIVTSGISCWDIQFKTGTKSEYVIIDLLQK